MGMFLAGAVAVVVAFAVWGWLKSNRGVIWMLKRIGFPPDRMDILEVLVAERYSVSPSPPTIEQLEQMALRVRGMSQRQVEEIRQTPEYKDGRDLARDIHVAYLEQIGRGVGR